MSYEWSLGEDNLCWASSVVYAKTSDHVEGFVVLWIFFYKFCVLGLCTEQFVQLRGVVWAASHWEFEAETKCLVFPLELKDSRLRLDVCVTGQKENQKDIWNLRIEHYGMGGIQRIPLHMAVSVNNLMGQCEYKCACFNRSDSFSWNDRVEIFDSGVVYSLHSWIQILASKQWSWPQSTSFL